ncbi:Thiol-disulfide isomerase or thioredoxin [Formosa sp. Hel1_31_208]|uniref:thioredoxin family protein n=1 Tax=Formosa sp. Hel1_31_208 TaxID=1798225 RepID=UPI00087CEC36|nr:thioredoxin family protein [Formosa sp. Hel1_31_208]SDR65719.1 Thiol-disulfide isomerase or thioredoxin [Formosa sp. Hel1_31_208]
MKVRIPLLIAFMFYMTMTAQNLNKEIENEGNTPFLLGTINKAGLTSNNYNAWFSENYDAYNLEQNTINVLSSALKDFNITIFMGTWCGDSKREVPRFYKILEACNFSENQLRVVALSGQSNMYKQSPNHDEAGLNIHRVPTFIFYKNGKEINRIVEFPVETLEKDMYNIVTTNTYKSNYQIVATVHTILKYDGLKGLTKQSEKLVEEYEGNVSNMFELNTYGRVLYLKNQWDEAIEVFRLNNKLFPNNPRTFMSLANTISINGNPKLGRDILKKATVLFPENENLKENLENLNSMR